MPKFDPRHCATCFQEYVIASLRNLQRAANIEIQEGMIIMANEQALADAVSTIDQEIKAAVEILTHLPAGVPADTQSAIDNAIATLSGDGSTLQGALDAANPQTAGGVNDGLPA